MSKTRSIDQYNKMVETTIRILRGCKIKDIRPMTAAELEENGWDDPGMGAKPMVIVLSDGTLLYPSCDSEGNAPGVLFFRMMAGKEVCNGCLQLWSVK